ncbi:polysaccharide pyruvyl transferase family protein [Brachybacterium tyrofermentans]|uniref:polysaccharide pyruvyl transferase family protein n=1 Tax=Brachybacterium tyrofermentans TaxID=47848 RepID=UPI003FD52998
MIPTAGIRRGEAPYLVDGVARDLLDSVPDEGEFGLLASSYDNLGNVLHAETPFALWDDGRGALIDGRRLRNRTGSTFAETVEFANESAGKFLLSAANFIQFGGHSVARRLAYKRLREDLERLEIPLVVLGLGVQAPRRWNPRDHALPPEAIDLLKLIGERCEVVSVRGEFSASILRDYAGVRNVMVTGCPSFFQRPQAFAELRRFLGGPRPGSVSFSMTNLSKPAEIELLGRAIRERQTFVDVQTGPLGEFSDALRREPELAQVPDALKAVLRGAPGHIRDAELRDFFRQRSVRFTRAADWMEMISREIGFSWGTRLHANMATLLAGRPALWVAHDSRTIEATNALRLPAVTLSEALEMSTEEMVMSVDYEPMFDHLSPLFWTFNQFLKASGLPEVPLRF